MCVCVLPLGMEESRVVDSRTLKSLLIVHVYRLVTVIVRLVSVNHFLHLIDLALI